MDVMSSEYDIYPRIFGFDGIDDMLLLHHTSAYACHIIGILLLDLLQLAESSEESLVGIFSDAASIDYGYIGIPAIINFTAAFFGKHARDSLRIVFVHLTSECNYVVFLAFKLAHAFFLFP